MLKVGMRLLALRARIATGVPFIGWFSPLKTHSRDTD
ncbi:hypothetical protein BH20ACI3_BH20ACI3_27050 [soil metagenome]